MLVICIRLSFSNVRPRGPLCVWPLLAARADLASCNSHEISQARSVLRSVRSLRQSDPLKLYQGFVWRPERQVLHRTLHGSTTYLSRFLVDTILDLKICGSIFVYCLVLDRCRYNLSCQFTSF